VFWVISVYVNIRNTLPKSGTFLLGHPVYETNLHDRFSARSEVRQFMNFLPGATQPIVGVYFTALYRALASSRTRLLDHIQRRATVGRTPLNE
jgi:hypothetical protein